VIFSLGCAALGWVGLIDLILIEKGIGKKEAFSSF